MPSFAHNCTALILKVIINSYSLPITFIRQMILCRAINNITQGHTTCFIRVTVPNLVENISRPGSIPVNYQFVNPHTHYSKPCVRGEGRDWVTGLAKLFSIRKRFRLSEKRVPRLLSIGKPYYVPHRNRYSVKSVKVATLNHFARQRALEQDRIPLWR